MLKFPHALPDSETLLVACCCILTNLGQGVGILVAMVDDGKIVFVCGPLKYWTGLAQRLNKDYVAAHLRQPARVVILRLQHCKYFEELSLRNPI